MLIGMGHAKRRVSPQIANQVNRDMDNLMTKSIVRAVKKAGSPWERNRIGRPCWEPKLVVICCFIKVFFNRTYDGTEAYIESNAMLCTLLHAERLPGHSVIARGMGRLPMSYIRLVSRYVTMRMRHEGMDVVLDSSGFSLRTSSTWFDIRIRRVSKRKDHMKLHIVIDADTLAILHFTITGWRSSETGQFKRLIHDLPGLGKVAGDKAYSSRDNCQAVADKGGTPYLCFKANSTGRAKGSAAWKVSFAAYSKDPESWMDEYHIRSVVEAVFASIKRCWGSDIRCRKGWLRWRILAIKTLAHNVKRALFVQRAEELGTQLWVSCK